VNEYDISFLVDSSVKWSEVYETIVGKKSSESLLKDALFVDEYHGKQVPDGKKSVTIRLVIGSKENTLTIPLSSFMEDEDDNMFVYIVENNELKKVKITSGINSEDKLEVLSGLTEDMVIVSEINSNYEEGMKVEMKK
jgi:multidrug efflux pump subunit AcrA (membrane-fusion protein)